jgi:hypothetical protein
VSATVHDWAVKKEGPTAVPGKDLVRISATDQHYSLGLVSYCPVHAVDIAMCHGGVKCAGHRKLLKSIAVKKAEAQREAAKKQAHKEWVRANGVAPRRPLGPRL